MSEDQIAELVSEILAAVGLKVLFRIAIHVIDRLLVLSFTWLNYSGLFSQIMSGP